ncbi:Translocation protein SEC62 [Dirofilaria immitis]|nr:Translocation protein SEC62 [Dirofilaria immitis]
MADRRKGGRKKSSDPNNKLTKEEDNIARYVRFNCPTKSTMFEGNEVYYFTEIRSYSKNVKFATRQSAVVFMRSLLEKDQKEKGIDLYKSSKKKSGKSDQSEKEKEKEKNKEEKKRKEEEEKKRRKIKLELHQDQSFNDANDVYVWIFDPTPLFKKVIGALMVLGTIAGCLFPLWPMWLRQGVYYFSICGLACFGILIGVAVVRTILFAVIWAASMGRHKLWLLPNLTEDCGFFESFQPWYTYEYCCDSIAGSDEANKEIEEEKQSQGKEGGDESADFGNGNENDETDDEMDNTSDSDGRTSQETNGSLNNGDDDAGNGSNDNGDRKSGLKRRARKADDDFVLIDK